MEHIVTLEEDEAGNLILPLPKELFEGDNPWEIGDILDWAVLGDKSIVVTNVSYMKRKSAKNG